MGTVNLVAPAPGEDVDAGPIATALAAIQAVLNGNIDAANIADGSITPAKLSGSIAGTPDVCTYSASRNSGQTLTATAPATGTYIVAFGAGQFTSSGAGSACTITTNKTGAAAVTYSDVQTGGGAVHYPGVSLSGAEVVTATVGGSGTSLQHVWLHLIRVS